LSIGGLYVGQLGLKSSITVELSVIKQYTYSLCVLAAFMICIRVLWVLDIVLLAKKELKQNNEEGPPDEDDGQKEGPYGDDDYAKAPQMSDKSFLTYFAVQVCTVHYLVIMLSVYKHFLLLVRVFRSLCFLI
jgi:hypothetical protein